MIIIGLTGGISSGKSTVSKILDELGAVIIDADIIAREVMNPQYNVFEKIVLKFGTQILNKDGTLNRKSLGKIVFNDCNKLKILNSITHPEIEKIIIDKINSLKSNKFEGVVVIDAAVLIESGMDKLVDKVWLVYLDEKTQLKRLMKRDNICFEEADTRIKLQMPVSNKIKFSDVIIDNTGDIKNTEEQVKSLWNNITKGKDSGGNP